MLVYWMLQIWPTSPIEQLAVAAHKVIDSRKTHWHLPMLCALVARIEPSIGSSRRHKLAAPLWLSPSAPLASPSFAQLRLSGTSGRCQSPPGKEPAAAYSRGASPLRARTDQPSPLSPSQLRLEEMWIKIIFLFFCIVFVIRWRRRVPAYLHFAYYYCI